MTLRRLVLQSMKKNMKQYYLYFFALIFSVTLYCSFITLEYNDSVQQAMKESKMAFTGFEVASYLLYFIVIFFVLYANYLFVKRRSKEIGLYQLIGMTKGSVVRLMAFENIILFMLAVIIGIGFGFLSSRLFAMILLQLLDIDALVTLTFSMEAVGQSFLIFSLLLLIIVVQMGWVIYRSSLLKLFNAVKQADERVKRFNVFHFIMGIIGISLIVYGYYESTRLFDSAANLLGRMLLILGTTIGGTFLTFRYSIALLMNAIRVSRKGYLSVVDVLSVTPIMHRMKGNAKSLTLITTLTGLAIGISCLSYISYYSVEEDSRINMPFDYVFVNGTEKTFIEQLEKEHIEYNAKTVTFTRVQMDLSGLLKVNDKENTIYNTSYNDLVMSLSDFQQFIPDYKLEGDNIALVNYTGIMAKALPLQKNHNISVQIGDKTWLYNVQDIMDEPVVNSLIGQGVPVMIVSDELFSKWKEQRGPQMLLTQTSVDLVDEGDSEQAEKLYETYGERSFIRGYMENGEPIVRDLESFKETYKERVQIYGMTIFVSAFLGIAFLLSTGSILYFKQMSEAEEEKEAYTIMRKLGFSTKDMMKGIYAKQVFTFGLTLMIGLLHSYFAVKSGWFFFGSQLGVPLIVTMGLYTIMYGIFAFLTTRYYKKVIDQAL